MGMFWELFQELQINKRKSESGTLEERVLALENELAFTQDVLAQSLEKLETMTGEEFLGEGEPPTA